ncbi:preprotein translocase subunit SecG [Candidatus Acetothermia bacterium]|jgi:preprotein translocase subunit SecG|nr:preprotein translocase subunit SecG [Candidatus Acetothermia bacterium]MCI2427018.1 preprotein translocase subunit SecG [Candidatus Acetothermia bacterium]MCI2428944.1 preprotein translocase subunit SecG [Candidatus Acetothermia bacterium]
MLRIVVEIIFFLNCAVLMGLILIQMSEHAGLGGAFGSGMSTTVFGRDETKDPKKTATVVSATIFMVLGFVIVVFLN